MANEKKVAKTKEASHGLNTAGKVLGILSIVFAAIFISAPLGLFLGIIGLILAIIYKAKGGERSSGLVLTIVGSAISIFMTAILVFVVGTVLKIVFSGMLGDWSCMTSDGEITTIGIGTNGYNIDNEVIDFDDFEIKDFNVSVNSELKEATVILSSDDVTYTCTKR